MILHSGVYRLAGSPSVSGTWSQINFDEILPGHPDTDFNEFSDDLINQGSGLTRIIGVITADDSADNLQGQIQVNDVAMATTTKTPGFTRVESVIRLHDGDLITLWGRGDTFTPLLEGQDSIFMEVLPASTQRDISQRVPLGASIR